jgi:hypothetical protein
MVANGYNHGDSQPIGWDMTWYNPLEVEVWLYIEFYITGTSSEMAGKWLASPTGLVSTRPMQGYFKSLS